MLPEIEIVRMRTDRVISPEEIARQLPNKSISAIKVNLGRAVAKGHIIRLGIGEYAHPKYESVVPPPKSSQNNQQPSESDWKSGPYAALIGLMLVGDQLDKKNHNDIYWLGFIRDACHLIKETWSDEQIKKFCTNMKEAMAELASGNYNEPKNFTSNISSKDLYKLITHPDD